MMMKNLCPYLGSEFDEHTALSYPSQQNRCYHTKPPAVPNQDHQLNFCLNNDNHIHCPIFATQKVLPMPANIQMNISNKKGRSPKKGAIISMGFIAILAVFFWMHLNQSDRAMATLETQTQAVLLAKLTYQPTATRTATLTFTPLPTQTASGTPTTTMTNTPIVSLTPTITASMTRKPTATRTNTPLPRTLTPTLIQPHLIETVIGQENQFVVHLVREGENFELLAANFDTSIEAIRKANFPTIEGLMANSVIIIPIGQKDPDKIPTLSAHFVQQNGKTITQIAKDFGIAPRKLSELNDLPEDYACHIGEWILIPQPIPTP